MRRRDWRFVACAVVFTVVLRLPFIAEPLKPDEAGYLLVGQWHLFDGRMYGAYWVDRPPLLLVLFKAVAPLAEPVGVRALGCLLVVVLVVASAVSEYTIAGARGARWAALTAACLGSSFAIGATEVDGELVAAPFVAVCCAATLAAVHRARRPGTQVLLAGLAGLAGTSAVLVKQNFVDGLVFAAVLLTVAIARDPTRRRSLVRILAVGAVTVLLVGAAVLAWATLAGPGVGALVYAMYGFRLDAAAIGTGSFARPGSRLVLMIAFAAASGMLVMIWWVARYTIVANRRRSLLSLAVGVMLVSGLVGIVGGGSYWLHYLLQLVPCLALGAAVVLRTSWPRRPCQLTAGFAAVSAVVATVFGVATAASGRGPDASVISAADVLHRSAHPGDTAVVTYGTANLLAATGMTSPYR